MIYCLPERIYEYLVKSNASDTLDKLKSLSDKYNSFTTFEEYVNYSSIFTENDNNKETYAEIEESIRAALKDKAGLLQEFELFISNSIDENSISRDKVLDDENYLAMLISYIDFRNANDKDKYFKYMDKFISYFESHQSTSYSKFIYYSYIQYKLLIISANKTFVTTDMTEEDIIAKCMNTIHKYYNLALEYSDDKDNINSQFCDWVCFFIRNINQTVEDNKIKVDLAPLYEKLDYFLSTEIGDYQYKNYNYGYLRFCDTMLMYLLFTIANVNKEKRFIACKELLNKIIDTFNLGLSDMVTLLRGLSYYDKSKVLKYVVLLRKYATIAINNGKLLNNKIINATPDDLRFILSNALTETKMDNYTANRINSEEAIRQVDTEAELMSNFIKLLGM